MEHLNLGRFTCGVDDYFLCTCCNGVVLEPVECSSCEDLLCSICSEHLTTCPSCHSDLETRITSRYALQIYCQLTLRCHNFLQGCNQEGLINDTLAHEKICEYEFFQCTNPLCLSSKMRIEKYCDEPLVCSENCKLIVSFDRVLKTRDQNLILTTLHTYLKELKEKELYEVTEKIKKNIEMLDEKLIEKDEFANEEQELRDEIEVRRKKFHPGKWNTQGKYWVCCLNKSKLALGYKKIILYKMNEEYISEMIVDQEPIFSKYLSLSKDIELVRENIFRYNRIMIKKSMICSADCFFDEKKQMGEVYECCKECTKKVMEVEKQSQILFGRFNSALNSCLHRCKKKEWSNYSLPAKCHNKCFLYGNLYLKDLYEKLERVRAKDRF